MHVSPYVATAVFVANHVVESLDPNKLCSVQLAGAIQIHVYLITYTLPRLAADFLSMLTVIYE